MPAGDRHFDQLSRRGIAVDHAAGLGLALDHRDLEHDARARADGKEGAVGRAPLGPEGGKHHLHHRIVMPEHGKKRCVEQAALVALGRALELVLEAEFVEEGAEPRVVVGAEAREGAEGIGHGSERFAEMLRQHLPVRHVVGHFAQAVHVVGEGEEPARQVRKPPEGLAHHRGARDLGEGADVRQARGTVAGLEEHVALGGRLAVEPYQQLSRLLEGPGPGQKREFPLARHGALRVALEAHAPSGRCSGF